MNYNIIIYIMIGGDKLSEGGYGCVFNPEINCSGKETNNIKIISKLQFPEFASKNEFHIGQLLKHGFKDASPELFNKHFAIIESTCNVDKHVISDDIVNQCRVLKKERRFHETINISNVRYINGVTLSDHINNYIKKGKVMKQLLSCLKHLYKSILYLKENQIVHFDLAGRNVLFDKNIKLPIIIDFGLSIDIRNLHNKFINYFINYEPKYYAWPLEVHYINYLIYHCNMNERTPKAVELYDMAKQFTYNNLTIETFSDEFKDKYNELCYKTLLNYNEMSPETRIANIISAWTTWDNYGISVMYLKYIKTVIHDTDIKVNKQLIRNLIELFLTNSHPNVDKRKSIEETIEIFKRIVSRSKNI